MRREPNGRKKLAIQFSDPQADWIEREAAALRKNREAHGNGAEGEVVRRAIALAMSTTPTKGRGDE